MTRGLVLGKFAPLHKGHHRLIERSLATCDETVVLVYDAAEVTRVPLVTRAGWVRNLYPAAVVIEGVHAPSATGRDPAIMKLQEDYIRDVVPLPVTHFFSSEWYGAHVSLALGAVDMRVDEARHAVPVSGTLLRADPFAHRHHVAPVVYRDLVRWIVLLGAESTGKSTMAAALATEFRTTWVPELGRDYWAVHHAPDGTLQPAQLLELAHMHRASEENAVLHADRLLFVDTDARITRQYARWYHNGNVLPQLNEVADAASARYHLAVLCADDFSYVEDGSRAGVLRRADAQRELRDELDAGEQPWLEVHGSVPERIEQVRAAIEQLGWRTWR